MLISSFQSGKFEVSVFDSLENDLLIKWEQVEAQTLSPGYLCFIEQSRPSDLTFLYVLVEEINGSGKNTVAILYFQYLKFTSQNINISNSFFLKLAAGLLLNICPFHFLICGNLFAVNFPAISFNPDKIGTEDIQTILKQMTKKIKADVFILKDLDEAFSSEYMIQSGWNAYPDDITMTLSIRHEWKTLSDYKKSLTKNYRKRADKIINAGSSIERRELSLEQIRLNEKKINDLFEQVAMRQIVRMGMIKPNYFYEFKKRFSDDFSFVGYYLKDELIGFTTYIQHGTTLETHYIGIDYRYNKSHMIYFNILIDAVQKAIEQGKEQLELGRTAREAKANIGAKPVIFNDYVLIKNRFAKILVKHIRNYFQKEIGKHWLDRHPFRKSI